MSLRSKIIKVEKMLKANVTAYNSIKVVVIDSKEGEVIKEFKPGTKKYVELIVEL